MFLEISQNSLENTCARASFLIKSQPEACNFIEKETLVQVFSCGFCEICKKNFFTEHLWVTASVNPPLNTCSKALVSQGSILGPTLFLLYINDLPGDFICNIAIYADDATLYSKCDNASDLCQQLELASEL